MDMEVSWPDSGTDCKMEREPECQTAFCLLHGWIPSNKPTVPTEK